MWSCVGNSVEAGERLQQPQPLANAFLIRSYTDMDRISAAAIASMLLTAPAWARGLTVRSERMRREAAAALAETIVDGLSDAPARHPDQLVLQLGPTVLHVTRSV